MKKQLLFLTVLFFVFNTIYSQTAWKTYNNFEFDVTVKKGTTLDIDNKGNKWLGSYKGVFKFENNHWLNYNTSNSGLVDNKIECISHDEQNNLWFGTTKGLSKYTGTLWSTFNTSNSGILDNRINCLTTDKQGNIWIGTPNGLSKFDGTLWTSYNTSNSGISGNTIRAITFDKIGNLWIGTMTGLSKFDGNSWITYTTSSSAMIDNRVSCIKTDEIGNIWLGTGKGVSKYDGTYWTSFTTSNSNIISNNVWCLNIDKNGNKWIGTQYGMSKFDDKTWINFNITNSGDPFDLSDYIFDVKIDSLDNKWITNLSGVTIYYNCPSPNIKKTVSIISSKPYAPCFNDSISLTAITSGVMFPTYTWNTNSHNQSIYVDDDLYKYYGTAFKLSVNEGDSTSYCGTVNSDSILFYPKPLAFFYTKDGHPCSNQLIEVHTIFDTDNVKWFKNGLDIKNTTKSLFLSEGGTYSVQLTSENNCTNHAEIKINTISNIKIVTQGRNPFCKGENVLLKVSSTKPSFSTNWILKGKDTLKYLDSVKVDNNSIVKAIVYDENKCASVDSIKIVVLSPSNDSICMVTNFKNHNLLDWNNKPNTGTEKYKIYKQSKVSSNYELFHEQSIYDVTEFLDTLSSPGTQVERYKISTVDSCGNESVLSPNHTTMLLSSNLGVNGTVNLAWNAYEGFNYANFEIWRSTDGSTFNMLSSVANNTFSFIDNNPPVNGYYQIRITNPNGCTPTKRGYSYVNSNTVDKTGKTVVTVGVDELNQVTYSIFPNPATSKITITSSNSLIGKTIELTTITGNVVKSIVSTKDDHLDFDISDLSKGVYLIHIDNKATKVVVE